MSSLTLGELACYLRAELRGDPALRVSGVAGLTSARPGEVALLTDLELLDEGRRSEASAFVVRRPIAELARPQLVCGDPPRALAALLELFRAAPPRRSRGVDARAVIEADAEIDGTAAVGPFCYVGSAAKIGPECTLEPFCCIGAGAELAARCELGPGVVVGPGCRIGESVRIAPGAVLGGPGFGFWRDEAGWHRVPSRGGVVVAEGCEVGANSCVDSGTLDPTQLGPGVKIDNLVQVGHNSAIGARSLLCAQVGLAGSVRLGEACVLGGQVGVADHRRLGRGTHVGAASGVATDFPPGSRVTGYPAIPHARWLRSSVIFARLGDLSQHVQRLARQVTALLERDQSR